MTACAAALSPMNWTRWQLIRRSQTTRALKWKLHLLLKQRSSGSWEYLHPSCELESARDDRCPALSNCWPAVDRNKSHELRRIRLLQPATGSDASRRYSARRCAQAVI